MGACEQFGHSGVAGEDDEPSAEEEAEAPGDEVGGDEHGGCGHEEEEEEGGGEGLVAEVHGWSKLSEDLVVDLAEVFHAVLQVAHVAEEVFGELFNGLDRWCWRDGRPSRRVFEGCGERYRGGGVPRDEGGDEDSKEQPGEWEHGEEMGVKTDEGIDCE